MFRTYVGVASQKKGRAGSRRRAAVKGGFGNENAVPEACVGRRPNAKGLRHFSAKVCEKVRSKRRTTYNEVADELVAELRHGVADEKNIRRRVYDALNVLMAVGVFAKVKKDIFWRGFPEPPARKVDALAREKARLMALVKKKQKYLEELTNKYREQKKLIERNEDRPINFSLRQGQALQLPCLLIKVPLQACVTVEMSRDLQDVYFDFHGDCFQIHDDEHLLRSLSEERVSKMPEMNRQCCTEDHRSTDKLADVLMSEEVLPCSPGIACSHQVTRVYPSCWSIRNTDPDFVKWYTIPRHQELNVVAPNFQFSEGSIPSSLASQWLSNNFFSFDA